MNENYTTLKNASFLVYGASLFVITFCDVATSVACDRLYWHNAAQPQFEDMWRLLRWLMAATEPLIKIVAVYMAAVLAFT